MQTAIKKFAKVAKKVYWKIYCKIPSFAKGDFVTMIRKIVLTTWFGVLRTFKVQYRAREKKLTKSGRLKLRKKKMRFNER
jgi:hypothetical protein